MSCTSVEVWILILVPMWQQQMAQQVLTQFQENPDAWTRVPDILERASNPQSKVGGVCSMLYDAVTQSNL